MSSQLLDTCIIIDYLRQKPMVLKYVHSLSAMPCVSAVTLLELYAGVKGKNEEKQLEALIAHSNVFEISSDVGILAGKYLHRYGPSHGLDAIDAMIAATCQVYDLELVTLNLKHFPMIERLKRPY